MFAQAHADAGTYVHSAAASRMGLVAAGIRLSEPGASLKHIPERWHRSSDGDSASNGKPLAGTT